MRNIFHLIFAALFLFFLSYFPKNSFSSMAHRQ